MLLGIEIGGTKLQLGVGTGDGGQLARLVRLDIDASRGASAILESIERAARPLIEHYQVQRVGFGFGGPVDSAAGVTTKSHQVAGWDSFPLARWCQEKLGRPAVIGNDCDVAALAEAHYGAGRGAKSVFYVTVGTGIGGGLVLNGLLHGAGRPAAGEIGHLRPGLVADQPGLTVESLAAGPAIAAAYASGSGVDCAMRNPYGKTSPQSTPDPLLSPPAIAPTAKNVAELAAAGNALAREVLANSCQALGWAIAQVITLIAPEVIVIGGGVSLIGDELFFKPLRAEVARYVFPPLANSFRIVPATLGELAVVHGAIAFAKSP
jgi:glucokinase